MDDSTMPRLKSWKTIWSYNCL